MVVEQPNESVPSPAGDAEGPAAATIWSTRVPAEGSHAPGLPRGRASAGMVPADQLLQHVAGWASGPTCHSSRSGTQRPRPKAISLRQTRHERLPVRARHRRRSTLTLVLSTREVGSCQCRGKVVSVLSSSRSSTRADDVLHLGQAHCCPGPATRSSQVREGRWTAYVDRHKGGRSPASGRDRREAGAVPRVLLSQQLVENTQTWRSAQSAADRVGADHLSRALLPSGAERRRLRRTSSTVRYRIIKSRGSERRAGSAGPRRRLDD